MALNTPLLYSVDAFDPAYEHSFQFNYSGTQVVANRAIITDNETQAEVYNVKQNGLKLNHVVPANALQAGKSYLIRIQVYDSDGKSSDLSDPVLFYCFTTPEFYFSNVQNGDTVSTANLTLTLVYNQAETESLSEYKYYVYDITKELVYTSDSFYTDKDMSHTVYGLKNDYIYYVRAVGKTKHNMSVDTGMIQLNVNYITIVSNMAFEATNDSSTGCIILKTNIINIDYELEDENLYSITNGKAGLLYNTLTYFVGTSGDFSLILQAKTLPLGEFCWTTDGNITVSIDNIANRYYVHLAVIDKEIEYDIFKPIACDYTISANGKYMTITNTESDTEILIAFEIYRKNNVYDISVKYMEG